MRISAIATDGSPRTTKRAARCETGESGRVRRTSAARPSRRADGSFAGFFRPPQDLEMDRREERADRDEDRDGGAEDDQRRRETSSSQEPVRRGARRDRDRIESRGWWPRLAERHQDG